MFRKKDEQPKEDPKPIDAFPYRLIVLFRNGTQLSYPKAGMDEAKECVKLFYQALGPFRPVGHDLGVFHQNSIAAVYVTRS